MNEPTLSGRDKLRDRIAHLRARLQKIFPFLTGVFAALLALLIYNSFSPQAQVTQTDVNNAVASALASATPRPPFSVGVYQIIQPSLVLIQTDRANDTGELDHSLGSGVIVNEQGDILTALHVVNGANAITLNFADGTKAEGAIISSQPEIDIAVLSSSVLPELFVPATLGNPGALQVGEDAYVVGNPFGLYSSMSAGIPRVDRRIDLNEPVDHLITTRRREGTVKP
jgi:S1-C subfamily serine protease